MLDRIMEVVDRVRDKWRNRDEIGGSIVEAARETPSRWRDSGTAQRLSVVAVVAICLLAIALTLF